VGVEPAGVMFTTVPAGPACSHWPANGCGTKYSIERATHGLAYTYTGRELIQLLPEEIGETGLHQNLIDVKAPEPVPAMVDVRITSSIDAPLFYQVAEVQVMGFGNVRHVFGSGYAETVATVPAQLDRAGLKVFAWTQMFADNSSQPARSALMDLQVQVTVRLPSAGYEVGENACVGSNGIPQLAAFEGNLPVVGTDFTVVATSLPIDQDYLLALPAFGLIGGQQMLPFDLGPFGMPSCYLHIAVPFAVSLENRNGTAIWTLPIPTSLNLVGAEFVQQVFALDAGANPLGAVITNYGLATIGAPPSVL
jgi:hypothetical protein